MPQIIDLSGVKQTPEGHCYAQTENNSDSSNNRNYYNDSFEENFEYLSDKYPGELLFGLYTVAIELNVSYEFVRQAAKKRIVAVKRFGKKMNVHKGELARIITEGIK